MQQNVLLSHDTKIECFGKNKINDVLDAKTGQQTSYHQKNSILLWGCVSSAWLALLKIEGMMNSSEHQCNLALKLQVSVVSAENKEYIYSLA